MQASPPQTEALLTLEEVRICFEQWRLTRKGATEKVPPALKAAAASLITRYRARDIIKQLKLDYRQLKSIQGLRDPTAPVSQRSPTPEPPMFMEVPLPSISPCSVELHHPNGMKLCLQTINERQLSSLVQTFMTNAPCCR